jgi:endonuclease/exonuclease/phosphatase family metal-dependent hydrolase
MSFNIRGTLRDMRKTNAWRNRASLNVATIGRCAPDVIGLQECQNGNLKAYRETCRDTPACVGGRREA